MPFLRRNFVPRGSSGGLDRQRQSAQGDKTDKVDDTSKNNSVTASQVKGTPSTSEQALPKKHGKRKRAGATRDPNARAKKSAFKSSDNNPPATAKPPKSKSSSSSAVAALRDLAQDSTTMRRTILEKIPLELHHDEAFISDRLKEAWREEARVGQSQNAGDANNFGRSTGDIASLSTRVAHASSMILPSDALLPSSGSGSTRRQSQDQPDQQLPPAYFHYVFMQSNNAPATFVEEIDGRVCPLCNFDGKTNEGLLTHCGRFHGMLRDSNYTAPKEMKVRECAIFEAALSEEGHFHVIVQGLPMNSSNITTSPNHEDFVFIKSRLPTSRGGEQEPNKSQVTIPYLQRHPGKAASIDTATRSKKLLALQSNDAPASVISAYLPNDMIPHRQYFHARTNLPLGHGEWMEDSDGETDDAWLHEMSSELLDEFEDVTEKEKQFMKLWNKFIKCNHVIADREVPRKCHEFVLGHRKQLMEGGLRLNLLLHLFNLWDSGVISSNRILSCMAAFDSAGCDDAVEVK
eukprot:CAMPEP_0183710410 /NCGR_PEP_ID=MMETSP0737-20130205/6144_1 /TAXON_ID=385413 /ORGANISM="Thalassiosira miniscula, Strain CCMP1093" /LENGTH=517 /DNA_ID=CAMNT_0025938671 /DNA_START=78 /DNA_END=1631 /DNA_ORIENTATION=+